MVRANSQDSSGDTGPILVCVHGGPGMDFSYMRPMLTQRTGFECVGYDQAPRIGEPIPGSLAAEDSIVELIDIARRVSAASVPVSLFAHSWGSYLAVEAVSLEPQLFRDVILCNPMPLTWHRTLDAFERLGRRIDPEDLAVIENLEEEGTERAGRELIALMSRAYTSPANHSIDIAVNRYNSRINALVMNSVEGFDQTRKAKEIASRVICIYGEDDFILPSDTIELVEAGARRHTLSGCGHFPFSESMDALASLLVRIA